jgi:site-specific DNA recombinase
MPGRAWAILLTASRRALAQRVEVDAKEVRITGSKSVLLRTLVAASSAKTAGFGVPSFVPKWRARRDSNS